MPSIIESHRFYCLEGWRRATPDLALTFSLIAIYHRLKAIVLYPEVEREAEREDAEYAFGIEFLSSFKDRIAFDVRMDRILQSNPKSLLGPWMNAESPVKTLQALFSVPFSEAALRHKGDAQSFDLQFTREWKKLLPAGEAILFFAQMAKFHEADLEKKGGSSLTKAADLAALTTSATRADILRKVSTHPSVLPILAGLAAAHRVILADKVGGDVQSFGMNAERILLVCNVAVETQRWLLNLRGSSKTLPTSPELIWHFTDDKSVPMDVIPRLADSLLEIVISRTVSDRKDTKTDRKRAAMKKMLLH